MLPTNSNAQISQLLKFWYHTYMGNFRKSCVSKTYHPPSTTSILPMQLTHACNSSPKQHLNNFCIAHHNKTLRVVGLLKSHLATRCYTIVHADIHKHIPLNNMVPSWLLQCTCYNPGCLCLARYRSEILCVQGLSLNAPPPFPSPHKYIPNTLNSHAPMANFSKNYHHCPWTPQISLHQATQTKAWNGPHSITIISIYGAIHCPSIQLLLDLQLPQSHIQTFMTTSHQNALKYFSFLILNKWKPENIQDLNFFPWPPPKPLLNWSTYWKIGNIHSKKPHGQMCA